MKAFGPSVSLPLSVSIMEVGPRDGLQNEPVMVDTLQKIHFIEGLVASGIKRIEVTAFVSPRWIPPLADQLEVALGVNRVDGVSYAALVPNVRGYERAMKANIDEVSLVISASDTHNQKNLNGDTDRVMERYHEVIKRAQQDGCPFRAYISCSFGCPYEGEVSIEKVRSLAIRMWQLGAYEVVISDTIGLASPISTMQVIEEVCANVPLDRIALHMHDTRGLALANIFSALTMGVASFDSSAGGLGGCPYAKGASGNVATEDLVNMFQSIGIDTGVSLDHLCRVSLEMEKILEKQVPSKIVATRRLASE